MVKKTGDTQDITRSRTTKVKRTRDLNQSSVRNAKSLLRKIDQIFNLAGHGARLYRTPKTKVLKQQSKFNQRVIVKCSYKILPIESASSRMAVHVRYLLRASVTQDVEGARAYTFTTSYNKDELGLFSCNDTEKTFRIIVSPENGHLLDMTAYTQNLIEQMQRDLGQELNWIAVNHYNTDNPHTHIVIKGKDLRGNDVTLPKTYMREGIRARASEIATNYLGPLTQQEINAATIRSLDETRVTAIDNKIIHLTDSGGNLNLNDVPKNDKAKRDRFMLLARLRKLEELELATFSDLGYKVDLNLLSKLKEMSERKDIIRTLSKHSNTGKLSSFSIYKPIENCNTLEGLVIDKGYHDDVNEIKYVTLMAKDGKIHYVKLSKTSELDGAECSLNSIVQIKSRHLKLTDKDIAIPTLSMVSPLCLEDQVLSSGITYLDKLIATNNYMATSRSDYEQKLQQAALKRIDYLLRQKYAFNINGRIRFKKEYWQNMILTETSKYAPKLNLKLRQLCEGETFIGKVHSTVTLPDGIYALINNSEEYIITPLKPGMNGLIGTQSKVNVTCIKERIGFAPERTTYKIYKRETTDRNERTDNDIGRSR